MPPQPMGAAVGVVGIAGEGPASPKRNIVRNKNIHGFISEFQHQYLFCIASSESFLITL
jgi:hypothetical protein